MEEAPIRLLEGDMDLLCVETVGLEWGRRWGNIHEILDADETLTVSIYDFPLERMAY